MKPPKKIKVGPYVFRVVTRPREIAGLYAGDTSSRWGRIRIHTEQHPMQVRATVLHELLHAVAHTAGIDDNVEFNQETFVSRMESGLLGLIRENPDLLEYLCSD